MKTANSLITPSCRQQCFTARVPKDIRKVLINSEVDKFIGKTISNKEFLNCKRTTYPLFALADVATLISSFADKVLPASTSIGVGASLFFTIGSVRVHKQAVQGVQAFAQNLIIKDFSEVERISALKKYIIKTDIPGVSTLYNFTHKKFFKIIANNCEVISSRKHQHFCKQISN